MEMPRFSLGKLLWSVSLLALGFGALRAGMSDDEAPSALVLLFPPLLGASAAVLFETKSAKAVWFCFVACAGASVVFVRLAVE